MSKTLKKVLIVEDDKDFLWLLRLNFENNNLAVVSAQNGEEGLVLAEKENPDLIIIDIMMPKMDGITMAKKIREKGILSKMIFLTNMNDSKHIQEAIEISGETDYIIKADMHIDLIVERVKNRLGVK